MYSQRSHERYYERYCERVTNLAGYCALSTRIGRTSTTADLARSLVVVVAAAAVAAPRRRGPCLDSLRIALLVRRGLRVCDFEF